ncbi:uncharacterized protein LOC135463364 [Liolophura sinensis]|uniref:uncharacterized protein LOC135463364 n=1 Tax=Liolophura sinensis TaxID=3198878 RepID=UPI0031586DC3
MLPLKLATVCSRQILNQFMGNGKKLLSTSTGTLKVHEEVQEALHAGKPVIALESAIITHGMPRPVNLQTARDVEAVVREEGVTPATVAVLHGKLHIGLTDAELEYLAGERTDLVKVSRRDLAYVVSQKLSGGTTVSATMVAAHKACIPIFVTGGIGGVHRGGEKTLDVSADLTELGRTPVTVISAGVKSILDIAKTLEFLETQGVCVSTFGQSKDFPAFFTPRSGHQSPYQVTSAAEAAKLIWAGEKLNLQSGNLIAVPIPEEFFSSGEIIESVIQVAVKEAEDKRIQGKEVTPYILQRVNELTGGESLKANVALVKNNATVGCHIAMELSKLKKQDSNGPMKLPATSCDSSSRQPHRTGSSGKQRGRSQTKDGKGSGRPVIVGGVVVDYLSKIGVDNFRLDGATYPGEVHQSLGGVGRNLADCLARLGNNPLFISVVSDDAHAEVFFSQCNHMDMSGVRILIGEKTPTYSGILRSSGQLVVGVGDMNLHQEVTPELISQFEEEISASPIVCVDGNVTPEAISYLCDMCSHHKVPVCFEPTDIHKAGKPFLTSAGDRLTYTSPNLSELRLMYSCVTGKSSQVSDSRSLHAKMTEAAMLCEELTWRVPVVMVTLGKDGVLLCHRLQDDEYPPTAGNIPKISDKMNAMHVPACSIKEEEIVSVSGAGDCLVSATISAILKGHDLQRSVRAGMLAAMLSLRSYDPVPKAISSCQLTEDLIQNGTS